MRLHHQNLWITSTTKVNHQFQTENLKRQAQIIQQEQNKTSIIKRKKKIQTKNVLAAAMNNPRGNVLHTDRNVQNVKKNEPL